MKNNQVKNNENAATLFLRKMAIIFLFLMLIIYIVFTIIYALHGAKLLESLMYLYTIQHIVWLFVVIYYKNLSIESLTMMYLSFTLVTVIYPAGCIFWNAGNPVVFFWCVIVIFGAMAFRIPKIGMWLSMTFAIIILIFFCGSMFPQDHFTPLLHERANIMSVIISIILTAFFIMVYVKNKNIDESMRAETLQAAVEDLEKNKALYNRIVEYLEKNEPFKNPDFDVHALARELNSNKNNISKAITAGEGGDFRTLLNRFRINYAKSMLDSGVMKIYTIDYIYTEAGYKYRSTFNNAFKNIIGMTPSDYAFPQNTNNNP